MNSVPAKAAEPRSIPREPVKNEPAITEARDIDGEPRSRPPAPSGAKREEDRPADAVEAEPTSKGRNSKTSTPLLSNLAEPTQSRSRPTRNNDPAPKRTAKKTPVQPTIPSDEESLHEGDDEDEEQEPRYCYCNEVSFGEMVACDNDACPREWFHLSCVGMTKPPGKNGMLHFSLPCNFGASLDTDLDIVKWYCNECKENMRRSRNGR